MSHTFFKLVGSVACACLVTLTPTFADDNAKTSDQKKAADKWISELSSKVQLTSEQTEKIREKLNKDEAKITETWQKFTEANAKAIALEATMYAAIEDGMTDQQKQQFRESRDSQAKADKGSEKLNQQTSADSAKNKSQKDDNEKQSDSDKISKDKSGKGESDDKLSGDGDNKSGSSDPAYVYVTETIIVPVQRLVSDVNMDDAQRKKCSQACRQFHTKLHKAWNDVSRYHAELVQLEADKMRAVESVLNEGQLQKLKGSRQDNG